MKKTPYIVLAIICLGFFYAKSEKPRNTSSTLEPIIVETNASPKPLSPAPITDNKTSVSGSDTDNLEPLPLRLLGTVLEEPALAYIENLDSARTGAYKKGGIIAGAEIVDIRPGCVIMDRNGHKEALDLCGSADNGDSTLSPHEIIINKTAFLKQATGKADDSLAMVKITPQFKVKSGEFSGIGVSGIRKGSILDLSGIENGDVIKVVNKQELSSPQKAIQIFRKLRTQTRADFDLLRDNHLLRLKYKIR